MEDLHKAHPQPEQKEMIDVCSEQLDLLTRELIAVKDGNLKEHALVEMRKRVHMILHSLNAERAKP